jgi:8-oxo-dGTP pyrophosphatase MutT (NUDIX family)
LSGPPIRTDIVEVFIARSTAALLLLRRSQAPMLGTWQPVFGHVESGESATDAALRELREETGLREGAGLAVFYALERVRPYYLPELDAVIASPRFVAIAEREWSPRLCQEHDRFRWFSSTRLDQKPSESGPPVSPEAESALYWPSQRESWAEAREAIFGPGGGGLRGATLLFRGSAGEDVNGG